MRMPADSRVEPALAKLRLALRTLIEIVSIIFEDRERGQAGLYCPGELLRLYEIKVVCRGVVLRHLAVAHSHQAADGEVECRRTVLSLVVAVREEVYDRRLLVRVFQYVLECAVNECVASAAALVCEIALVTNAGQNDPMPDARQEGLVPAQPCDRADGAWNE